MALWLGSNSDVLSAIFSFQVWLRMFLKNKCALITGSVQGLGLAAAHRFAAAGCHIVLNGFAEPEVIARVRG